jgi:hypothetical protein
VWYKSDGSGSVPPAHDLKYTSISFDAFAKSSLYLPNSTNFNPKGNKFEINFKHYSGSNPTFEPRTAAIKDFWEKVGLKTNVKLVHFHIF